MTATRSDNPLIVQSDHTVLIEVDHPRYPEARDALAAFAELVKSPEHVHTYRLSALSIWNACAAGLDADRIVATLRDFAKYPPPDHVIVEIRDYASRFGRLIVERGTDGLLLRVDGPALAEELWRNERIRPLLAERPEPCLFAVKPADRGRLKQTLIKAGFPADDRAGYRPGAPLPIALREATRKGAAFALRDYQRAAADAFHREGSELGGSGVIVLPCGAGKTMVAMACMNRVGASTLILATNTTAVRQWRAELLDKTLLHEDQVGEYTGFAKEILPVTIATYQILTHRASAEADFAHLALFDQRDWGLIVYDEVHLLPAPVFQITATLQARRRLGLTATLVREDGREDDVFALIGPKRFDVPWKRLERQGWIATASCEEIRVGMSEAYRMDYAVADKRQKFRIASENPAKTAVVRRLLDEHRGDQILILSMYLEQIEKLAAELDIPIVSGTTGQARRERLYADFRSGRLRVLACTKVANFSVDLPDASVAIQISGTFGSRQEEAQRLGRILRPKPGDNQAHFYTLVSHDTVEQEFALNRQLFLCEQGYQYAIRHEEAK